MAENRIECWTKDREMHQENHQEASTWMQMNTCEINEIKKTSIQ